MHKQGDSVRIIDPSHPQSGSVHEVLEASSEDGTVRTSLGWFIPDQVEPAGGISAEKAEELNREIEVDGERARLRSVPAAHVSSRTIEQVIDLMASKQIEIDKAKSERGRAGKAVQDREKEREAMIRELYALRKADDPNQALPFEPEDEPEEDDDQE